MWWLIAILLFPGIWLVAALVSGRSEGHLGSFGPPLAMAVALVGYLFAAIPEEIGWRGFALAFQTKHTALTASLIVGALWAILHLPVLLGGNAIMSSYPLASYLMWVVVASVLYTWLYNSTRGSLIIVVVLHAFANVAGAFSLALWAIIAVTAVVAELFWLLLPVAESIILIAHLCATPAGSALIGSARNGRGAFGHLRAELFAGEVRFLERRG